MNFFVLALSFPKHRRTSSSESGTQAGRPVLPAHCGNELSSKRGRSPSPSIAAAVRSWKPNSRSRE